MASLVPDLRHHRQDDFDDCGRASAQMVIGYVMERSGTPGLTLPQQDDLEQQETGGLNMWATEPGELPPLINNNVSTLTSVRWGEVAATAIGWPDPPGFASTSPPGLALLGEIKRSIDLGVPAIVSKHTSDHWIVVTGYATDASGRVVSLTQADPLSTGAIGNPFQHAFTDTCQPFSGGLVILAGREGEAFIIDADPFPGQAVAIVGNPAPPASPTNLRIVAARAGVVRWFSRWAWWWRGWWQPPKPWPPPPWSSAQRTDVLGTVAKSWHAKLMATLGTMPEWPGRDIVASANPTQGVVRFVEWEDSPRLPYVLVGAPTSDGNGLLIQFDMDGTLREFTLTSRDRVSALGSNVDPVQARDMTCRRGFGIYQPFEKGAPRPA